MARFRRSTKTSCGIIKRRQVIAKYQVEAEKAKLKSMEYERLAKKSRKEYEEKMVYLSQEEDKVFGGYVVIAIANMAMEAFCRDKKLKSASFAADGGQCVKYVSSMLNVMIPEPTDVLNIQFEADDKQSLEESDLNLSQKRMLKDESDLSDGEEKQAKSPQL